jgi:hypothetical protein
VQVDVGDGCIYHIKSGERVRAISSGKWGKSVMAQVVSAAGLQMNHAWGDCSGLYCMHISPLAGPFFFYFFFFLSSSLRPRVN